MGTKRKVSMRATATAASPSQSVGKGAGPGDANSEEIVATAASKKSKIATKAHSQDVGISSESSPSTRWWLFKSEPEEFSIGDLEASPARTHHWDGVRNYQARNFMRDMKVGDRGFFYHSNAGVAAGIVGTVTVVREAYPDPSCLDPKSKYYDPKSSQDNPRWSMVDVRLDERWARPVLLSQLRNIASAAGVEVGGAAGRRGGGGEEEETGLLSEEQTRAIAGMKLLQRGMRLSVQPLTLPEWDAVNALSRAREGRYESNKN